MQEKARSFPCVSLLYRHQLESFEADEHGVTARVKDFANRELAFRSQYLAGCDGAGSRVRRSLGINLLGSDALSSAMHVYFRARDLFDDFYVKPGTFFAAVDKTGYWGNIRAIDPANGLWRILFDVPPDFNPKDIDYDKCIERAFAKPLKVEWIGQTNGPDTAWWRKNSPSAACIWWETRSISFRRPGRWEVNTGVADAVDLGLEIGSHLLRACSPPSAGELHA